MIGDFECLSNEPYSMSVVCTSKFGTAYRIKRVDLL